jgi:hypothetical protein
MALRSFWATLSEIPLALLGATAAGTGVACLWSYFHAVGYIPTDLGSVLGSAVLAGALVAMYFFALATLMFAPAVMHHFLGSPAITRREIVCSMLLGLFGVFSAFTVATVWSCGKELRDWHYASILVAVAGLFGVLWGAYGRFRAANAAGWERGRLVAVYLVSALALGLASLYIFIPLLEPVRGISRRLDLIDWPSSVDLLFLVILLLTIFLNVGVTSLVSARQRFAMALTLVVVLYLPTTFLPGSDAVVPKRMAAAIGLRSPDPVTLLVPDATCQILRAVSTVMPKGHLANTPSLPACTAGFHRIRAEVHVRTGSRWWVRAAELDGVAVRGPAVTIPDMGTQIVEELPATTSHPAAASTGGKCVP